jgi:hypothetical protein
VNTAARAHSAYEDDPLDKEPTGHESENLGGGLVEPLGVLDHTDQRLGLGDLGQKRQGGQPDQEPVGRQADGAAKHDGQGVALGGGQPVQVLQHRRAELMQAGVGQLHLRLHAHRSGDLPAGDPLGQVLEQRGLAHAGLPAQDQSAARS